MAGPAHCLLWALLRLRIPPITRLPAEVRSRCILADSEQSMARIMNDAVRGAELVINSCGG